VLKIAALWNPWVSESPMLTSRFRGVPSATGGTVTPRVGSVSGTRGSEEMTTSSGVRGSRNSFGMSTAIDLPFHLIKVHYPSSSGGHPPPLRSASARPTVHARTSEWNGSKGPSQGPSQRPGTVGPG
jgi:hypothetical protein